jgi:hypothetical protein
VINNRDYSFVGVDYTCLFSCTNISSEVDGLVAEMRKVADIRLLDAHASAQYSITSMHKRYAPGTPAEGSPLAFLLPDIEAQQRGDVTIDPLTDNPMSTGKLWGIAKQIVDLKRAGKDREALTLLMGKGGRAVEGFPVEAELGSWEDYQRKDLDMLK